MLRLYSYKHSGRYIAEAPKGDCMKIIFIGLLAAALLFTSSCASIAARISILSGRSEQAESSGRPGMDRMPRGGMMDNENAVVGKIVSVSEAEITIELADIERPQRGDRQNPPGDMPENGDWPQDGAAPPGERPESGDFSRDGRPGGGTGRGGFAMNFTYTGEQKTYALPENLSITGQNGDALTVADLLADDVVWLLPDENDTLVSIRVMRLPDESRAEK